MADKRIADFPTLEQAQDTDLILVSSQNETYNITFATLKEGTQGEPGVGIESYTDYYAVNNSTTPPADSAFSTTVVNPTSSNRYLWGYTVIEYSDTSQLVTDKHLLAVYGEHGDTGYYVSNITNYYLKSANNTGVTRTGTSGWSTTVPTLTDAEPYLWGYTKFTLSSGSNQYSTACVIGSLGTKGDKGDTGATGPQGPQGEPGDATIEYVSGPSLIVSVDDAAALDAVNVTCAIEPVQDLHGYDNPWPAGGGKNKFDPSVYSAYLQSDGKYRARVSVIDLIHIPIPSTLLNTACTFSFYADMTNAGTLTNVLAQAVVGGTSENGTRVQNGSIGRSEVTFTPTSESDYIHITFGSEGANEFTFYNIQLEAGSAVTDYSSYSNICPITGWTGMNVNGTGKNVWDEETRNGYYGAMGEFFPNSSYIASKNKISVLPSTSYTIHCAKKYIGRLCFYNADETFISTITGISSVTDYNFSTPSKARYMNFDMTSAYGNTYTNDISINYPSTDTSYHAYQGNTYPISWQSTAGTVYGGTLDVTTGLLTVTMAEVDLGTLNWAGSQTLWSAAVTLNHTNGTAAICSQYKDVGNVSTANMTNGQIQTRSNYVFVCDTNYTDAATFKAAMSGVQLVYELATPVEYTLTPQDITLLRGTNNVFADCGNTTLTYFVIGTDDIIATVGSSVHGIPAGGTSGQVLKKASGTDYDTEWANESGGGGGTWGSITGTLSNQTDLQNALNAKADSARGLPTGGTTGQALVKSSSTDYATSWATMHGIPSGGTSGQALVKSSGSDYAVAWGDVLPKDISSLSALSQAPATGDLLPIYSGNATYKIDYNALANAVIQRLTPDYANAANGVDVKSGTDIYTATSRCILSISFANSAYSWKSILVNSKTVALDAAGQFDSTHMNVRNVMLPLDAGDVVTSDTALSTNAFVHYVVIPYKA